ncbi:MAG: metallophosphoesterase [Promethearchaeota archaeon]|jgi:UDP-2,3-diacylglucosamine pyrophosphatase LpxH
MSENKPIILVLSDVHLGSLGSEKNLFIQFLSRIINGEYGNELQALIILGDFIDLCMDIPRTLLKRKKIQKIFTLLLEIKKKMNLVFLLGNHEIPVTGDYDEKFERRKKKFLYKFRNCNFKDLFNKELYYQYALLKKEDIDNVLSLYNSREQIENNPVNKLKIIGLDLSSDYRCLMTHGYQFESEVYRVFVGQLWKSLISSNDFGVKETHDYFWNQIIKKGRKIKPIGFERMKEELAKLKRKSIESMDKIFSGLNLFEFHFIKASMRVMKRWYRVASKPNYFLDEIKEFLEDDDYDFSKINHVIYGHFHFKDKSVVTINQQQVEVINDGSWQHTQPSYLEICNEGKIFLKSFDTDNSSLPARS